MPTQRLIVSAATLAVALLAPVAIAQDASKPAVDLVCSDVATLEAAHAAALVYYIAGYVDGQASGGNAGAPATAAPAPGSGFGMAGGLTLSAAAVLAACGAQPDTRIADVVASLGGSMAAQSAPAPTGDAAPPAEEATPAEETAPAGGTTEAPADPAATEVPAEGTQVTPPATPQ